MDDHESCTAMCMHLAPLNCRVKYGENIMFYIMWILLHYKSIKHIYKQKKSHIQMPYTPKFLRYNEI